MALSFVEYVGNGTQTDFPFSFPYISRSHVKVSVNDIDTAFTFFSSSVVRLSPAPASGAAVKISRVTPDSPLVNFVDGSTLTEVDLDTATLQAIYLAQEAVDKSAASATFATQAQAEAGTDNTTVMTPLRTAQAITVLGGGGGGGGTAASVAVSPTGGISSTNVQAALAELDTEKAAASHTHTVANITDMSANGRSLVAATYANMKTLLAITLADITDMSANGRSLVATTYANMKSLLAITASDITNSSVDGRAILTATNYAAMKTALAFTAADITNASADGRSLITAANFAAMRTALGLGAAATANFASNAQAIAGTDNTTVMTPLRTAEAIAALAGGGGGSGSALTTTFSPSGGLSSTNVQAALVELDTEKAAATHTHTTADITGLNAALTGKEDAGTAASVAGVLSSKAPVACVATSNITLSGEQTIDGVLTSASRVLVVGQTTPSQNGLYISAAGAWSRSSLADSWTELAGSIYSVTGGTVNGGSVWRNTNVAGGTLGTTNVTFERMSPVPDNSITYARLQDASAGNVVLARANAAGGDFGEVAIGASQLLGRGATGDIAPITLGTNLSMSGTTLNASGGGGASVPVGTIIRSVTDPGAGWLLCDGTWKSRTLYPDLFAHIGTRYGVADGSSFFVLPRILSRVNQLRNATSLPAGRAWHSMIALQDGRIMIVGGNSGTEAAPVFVNTVYFGSIAENGTITWTTGTNYPIAAAGIALTQLADGRVVGVGGMLSTSTSSNAVHFGVISGDTITWTAGTNYPTTIGAAAIQLTPDNRIWVAGGFETANVNTTRFGTISGDTITWVTGSNLPFTGANASYARNNVDVGLAQYLYAPSAGTPQLLGFTNGSTTVTFTSVGTSITLSAGQGLLALPCGTFTLFQHNGIQHYFIDSQNLSLTSVNQAATAPLASAPYTMVVAARHAVCYVPQHNVIVVAGGLNGASALASVRIYYGIEKAYIKT